MAQHPLRAKDRQRTKNKPTNQKPTNQPTNNQPSKPTNNQRSNQPTNHCLLCKQIYNVFKWRGSEERKRIDSKSDIPISFVSP
jgi:hypothetical protein